MVTYPSDWTESKLLDHVNLVQGLTYTPENVKPHGTLVLRSSNIQEGHLALEDNVYVDSIIPEDKMIQEGDILVCVRNGSSALIGKSCVLPAMSNTTFGAFMSVLRGDRTGYIAKVFESDIVQEQVRGRSNATINQITKKDFKSITVTMPDENEQKAIAGVLSRFDSYISDLAELIEKKKAIRDGALEDLVSGRTRLAGYTEPWSESSLGSIGTFTKGAPLSKAHISSSGTPFILYGELYTTYHEVTYKVYRRTEETTDEAHYSRIGDVIIPTSGETAEEIATACCVMVPGVILAGDLNIYRSPELDGRFLSYVIKHVVNQQISELAQGISIIHINAKALKKIVVRYPKREEQSAIADIIDTMDTEISALEDERNKMLTSRSFKPKASVRGVHYRPSKLFVHTSSGTELM